MINEQNKFQHESEMKKLFGQWTHSFHKMLDIIGTTAWWLSVGEG